MVKTITKIAIDPIPMVKTVGYVKGLSASIRRKIASVNNA